MTFSEYQQLALATRTYPDAGRNTIYPALKLAGEAGEVADKIGKIWRNEGFTDVRGYSAEQLKAICLELGDVLWYIAALGDECGIGLDLIALANLQKLKDRKKRGVIKGEGDNR